MGNDRECSGHYYRRTTRHAAAPHLRKYEKHSHAGPRARHNCVGYYNGTQIRSNRDRHYESCHWRHPRRGHANRSQLNETGRLASA
ncbi:hypothetical protein D3C85_1273180 [compost metagenome]